jgi:hypothetical protein
MLCFKVPKDWLYHYAICCAAGRPVCMPLRAPSGLARCHIFQDSRQLLVICSEAIVEVCGRWVLFMMIMTLGSCCSAAFTATEPAGQLVHCRPLPWPIMYQAGRQVQQVWPTKSVYSILCSAAAPCGGYSMTVQWADTANCLA